MPEQGSDRSTTPGTVVLVHGLSRSAVDFYPLGRVLRKAGYPTLTFGYASRSGMLDSFAERLEEHLERKRDELSYPLNFVGHSLGALVIRRFAQRFGLRWRLGRCVMLGPPNQGSELARIVERIAPARWFFGPVLREVASLDLSQSVGGLEVGVIAGGTGRRGFSPLLRGDNDFIVGTSEARLLTATDYIELPALHAVMMFQPSVIRQVVHFIREGRFARTTGPLPATAPGEKNDA